MHWKSFTIRIKALALSKPPKGSSATTATIEAPSGVFGHAAKQADDNPSEIQQQIPSQPQCRLLQLPSELLDIIRSYLAPFDLLLLSLTCRHFYPWSEGSSLWHIDARWTDRLLFRRYLRKDKCYAFLQKQASGLENSDFFVCGGCLDVHVHYTTTRNGPI